MLRLARAVRSCALLIRALNILLIRVSWCRARTTTRPPAAGSSGSALTSLGGLSLTSALYLYCFTFPTVPCRADVLAVRAVGSGDVVHTIPGNRTSAGEGVTRSLRLWHALPTLTPRAGHDRVRGSSGRIAAASDPGQQPVPGCVGRLVRRVVGAPLGEIDESRVDQLESVEEAQDLRPGPVVAPGRDPAQ